MQSQAQVGYENPGQESSQELFPGQMEQAVVWSEFLAPRELSKSGKPQGWAGRESKLDISLNSPWLYLSLILLLGLLWL
jgi:hypothetical protein